jgi:hypothetical protein
MVNIWCWLYGQHKPLITWKFYQGFNLGDFKVITHCLCFPTTSFDVKQMGWWLYLICRLFQCYAILQNQVKIVFVFRPMLTVNLIDHHFFSHMGWKSRFSIIIKLKIEHHGPILFVKKLDTQVGIGFKPKPSFQACYS